VNPVVHAVLAERGLDISNRMPQKLAPETVASSDVVITMGCGDACPVFPGTRYLDWKLDDPAGQPIEVVRPIVDEIERRVLELLVELMPT
jgi:arsenate reductase (thioredoxin)